MLLGRKYRLALTPEQEAMAEEFGNICRAVWNTGLEQRREYRRRGAWMNYVPQAAELAEAKCEHPWLRAAPSHILQQTLRDLDRACRERGTLKVRWRSKSRWAPSFRFPNGREIKVQRLSRKWGQVKLHKLGWVKFRWSRPLGGLVRSATVSHSGSRWWISFVTEDGLLEAVPNGKPSVGVDRGVKTAVVTSDGWMRNRQFVTPGEAKRLKRLQQQLARSRRGSRRRAATKVKLIGLHRRIRDRRNDFNAWTANRLTRTHGLVAFEDLKITNMTASARGTLAAPGTRVRQKAGLNRAILAKGWGDLLRRTEHKAKVNGSRIVRVPAAYTSQTCNACGHCAPENRESQAAFRCASCGHQAHADVNAAKNILAAGLAVTGRGDLGITRSVKRQPPGEELVT